MTTTSNCEYHFEPFRFVPAQQLLLNGERPVRLGSRALDILAALVERPGEVLGKRELMARAWPNSVVEEDNLKVHVAALRRALLDNGKEYRYVATVSGRGYRFVAPVVISNRETAPQPAAIPANWEQIRKLPLPATCPTGRAETIASVLQIMEQRRLVSIVGTGGIGKSTVALPVVEAYTAQANMEACFVDLSPVADAQFLAGAVAAALGVHLHGADGVQALIATLRERRVLLVLDSCEHLVDAVAVLVERLIGGAAELRVLATSREPLRVAGEYVYRLTPLPYPAAGTPLSAAQGLGFPAIQLFVQRAAEGQDGYQLSDADAPAVAEICRRLEGIPLAIELAATRMDALGAAALAERLGDRFQLLKRGRRGALERHRTLEAALDWSYELLPEDERSLLRALAVFAGGFTLDDASSLCQHGPLDVVDGVAGLVDKSLLSADLSRQCVLYRLLDTTKAYALEKLDLHGETEAMRCRHLHHLRAILERASEEWSTAAGNGWAEHHGRHLDDVRAALAWAFGPGDAAELGIALTVAAIPLWVELSLLEEGRRCITRALGCAPDDFSAMRLEAALGAVMLYSSGPIAATESAWSRVLVLADAQQNAEYQSMSLWGLAVCRSYAGDVAAVRSLTERFQAASGSAEKHELPVRMERLIGAALHYAGDQAAARSQLEQMLAHYVPPARSSHLARFQLDQRAAALTTLAYVLWLQGETEAARNTVQQALQEARASGHAQTIMYVISNAAFPLMMQMGDFDAAQALLDELALHLKTQLMTLWQTLWQCLQATLAVQRGDAAALPRLQQAVSQLQQAEYRLHLSSHVSTLAMALGQHGRHAEGLVLINDALATCAAGQERWLEAEMLRIKGTLLEASDPAAAEQAYRQALAIAEAQGARAWQQRAAASLERLQAARGLPK